MGCGACVDQWPWSEGYTREVVRPEGIEPPTLWSEARCSNPLSYGRMFTISVLVGARGFEPPTSSSRTTRATKLRYAPTDPVRRRVGRIADALESDPSA